MIYIPANTLPADPQAFAEVDRAVTGAAAGTLPTVADLTTDVYVNY